MSIRPTPRGIARSPCLAALRDEGRILHRTVSSRAARTRANPLFPVNYLDRELRKDLHEHVRESVCFGRNVNRQMERLSLYLWWHNYMKRHRARGPARSHAAVAGYDLKLVEKGLLSIWDRRAWLTRIELDARDAGFLAEGAEIAPSYAGTIIFRSMPSDEVP